MAQDSSDIELFMLTSDDYEEVAQLFDEQFAKRNPLCKVCKETSLEDIGESMVKDIKRTLASGLSTGVRDKTTKAIVGFQLTDIFHVDKTSTYHVGEEDEPSIMYQLLARFSPHGKEIQELGISPILDIFALCVHKAYGGRGIAVMIIKKTLELGDEQGCRLAVVQIANSLSEKIFNRLNFQTIKVLDLDTVADEFDLDTSIIPGESILSLMVKNLPSKTSNPHPQ